MHDAIQLYDRVNTYIYIFRYRLFCHAPGPIEERDHMVLYITDMGASLPYKFVEQEGDLFLYERKKENVYMIIKRSPKVSIVALNDGFETFLVATYFG